MFYCPKCRYKLLVELDLKNIPADYSTNILISGLNLAICSLGNFMSIDIKGYTCPNCNIRYNENEIYIRSSMSDIIDKRDNFIIVSVKSKSENIVNGKVCLVIPPRVIHKSELEKYKKQNPYKEDKYLICKDIETITFSTPK